MSVKISAKYQIIIPEAVRSALGLKPGTEVDVIAKGGIGYIVPIRSLQVIGKQVRLLLPEKGTRSVRDKKDRKL